MQTLITILQWILRLVGLGNPAISQASQLHAAHRADETPLDALGVPDPEPIAQPTTEVMTEPSPPAEPPTEPAPVIEVIPPAPPVTAPRLPPIEMDKAGVLIGKGVTYVPSERIQRLATPDGNVDGITWHWTDTRGVGAVALAKRTIKKAANVGSCHLWLGADGEIAQSAPMLLGSWHAGFGFTFKRDASGVYRISPGYNANAFFAGVEIENIGEVRKTTLKGKEVWAGWPFNFLPETLQKYGAPTVCPDDEVYVHPKYPNRGWHKFTQAQRDGAERIVRALRGSCALTRENCSWGHLQIDPERRTDPGPLWMGTIKGDGYTVPTVGTQPDGILHKILDAVFTP